jgi:hypothetical protein
MGSLLIAVGLWMLRIDSEDTIPVQGHGVTTIPAHGLYFEQDAMQNTDLANHKAL